MNLKNHPFAVEAFFDSSIVLTYALPKEELEDLIPEYIELDTFQKKYGFLAVAMVNTKYLRPKGAPKFLGNDFFLIGYRMFVRYTNQKGKRLRGLYILKSATNKRSMSLLGKVFTHYNYETTDINYREIADNVEIRSDGSSLNLVLQKGGKVTLPSDSPFESWKEARRYSGPLPFTFTCSPEKKEVLIIEGVRQNWVPEPIKVKSAEVGFLSDLGFENIQLASAFLVRNVPYFWKKGRVESWA